MILDPKKTTLSYRCPACGGGVLAPVGVFSVSADRMRLKCPCGQSSLTVLRTREGKIRLDVPCLACGVSHPYTVSEDVFFGQEIFCLPCSLSGIDICFFGKEEEVSAALKRQEEELRSMVADELAPEEKERLAADGKLGDAEIYDIIRFLLMELEADGQISCACGEAGGDYDAECIGDHVRIFCRACGKEKNYPISSVEDAQKFLAIDRIRL